MGDDFDIDVHRDPQRETAKIAIYPE